MEAVNQQKKTILPAVGLHHNVPFATYQQWDAVNQSRLKPLMQSPAHCKWAMDNPRPESKEMQKGKALHAAIFEPSVFEEEFCTIPKFDKRTKEGKADYTAAMEEAEGKTVLDETEMETVQAMAKAVRSKSSALQFIDSPGSCEVSALWRDDKTELLCKARFDKLVEFSQGKIPVILDLKTTRDACLKWFARDYAKYGYHIQSASYKLAHFAITGKEATHVTIAVENVAPYEVAVYISSGGTQMAGENTYRNLLGQYARCAANNFWPGYPNMVQVLDIPMWSQDVEVSND